MSADIRFKLWNDVLEKATNILSKELISMNTSERAKFILNAMECKYVREWSQVYDAMLKFVCDIYLNWCI